MEILSVIVGFAVGAVSALLISKFTFDRERRIHRDQIDKATLELALRTMEKATLEERNGQFETTIKAADQSAVEDREKILMLSTTLATTQTELKNSSDKLEQQKDELLHIRSQFSAEFRNLANDILEEKSRKFTELNKDNLTLVLDPLERQIKDFQTTVSDTYGKESSERVKLVEQIRQLTDLNQKMTKEAANLTTALQGQSKTQGDWGELVLEQILERSGLVKGTHYTVQQAMIGEEGKTLKPDVVINLPDGKHLVIDSKVSLTAFTEFCNAESADLQRTFLAEHLGSIKKHIRELSEKKYQNIYQLQSVDFVLMFINLEPAFIVAARDDPNLYNEAFERNIVIVSASTLMATLRTIANIWRRENQSKNAIEIARKSGDLYDKFVGFIEDLKSLGEKLQASQKAYDDALSKLSLGKGNLIRRVEDLKQLGAKTSKSLPSTFIDNASDSEVLKEPDKLEDE